MRSTDPSPHSLTCHIIRPIIPPPHNSVMQLPRAQYTRLQRHNSTLRTTANPPPEDRLHVLPLSCAFDQALHIHVKICRASHPPRAPDSITTLAREARSHSSGAKKFRLEKLAQPQPSGASEKFRVEGNDCLPALK